ncbi:MAG: radical SAM protein [Actinomycetota bacterium]|nr:radical SAM protein [Actinomycetota bacterium]
MYSPLRYAGHILWKRRPIQLTFFVTKRCNAKCPFCFYLQEPDTRVDRATEISLQEVGRLAPSLERLLWLAFSGGEAYLREDIVELSKVSYKHNKPSIILYSTNGLATWLIKDRTEEILKSYPNSTVVVKLSLDGLYGEHDALRGVPGSFEKVMDTYESLSGIQERYSNFELGVNTVFCAANQDRIGGIFEFVKGLKDIRTHTLSMVRDPLKDKGLKDVDLDKYREAIKTMEADLKKRLAKSYRFSGTRLKSAQDILQRRLIHRTLSEDRCMLPCFAGRLNLVLTESGDVYPCELLDRKFGNIKDHGYDIRKLLQSDEAKAIVQEIKSSKCHCSHECYFITNILFNPRTYPMLMKEYLQL